MCSSATNSSGRSPLPIRGLIHATGEIVCFMHPPTNWAGWRNCCSNSLRTAGCGDRNLAGGEIFRACPDRPWGLPSVLYSGYRFLARGYSGLGVALTTHTLQAPRLQITVWAFMDSSRVNCTFFPLTPPLQKWEVTFLYFASEYFFCRLVGSPEMGRRSL